MTTSDDTAVGRPRRLSLGGDGEGIRRGGVVGEWRVERYLGHGGCGTVYECIHVHDGTHGALKVMHAELAESAEMNERFVREVQAAALVPHPAIVRVFASGKVGDGRPFFVMEYLDGNPLSELLRTSGRFVLNEIPLLLGPVAGALDAAHAAGVIHRDVKAANVLVLGHHLGSRVKLLDFGIAKLLRPETHASSFQTMNVTPGTPAAMAPEQILGGPVDARTDVYALGVLAFQLLTGRYPFQADEPFEIERMHVQEPPPRPSAFAAGLGPSVDALVQAAMAKVPADRPVGAGAFVAALSALAERR
jgi:serine/threonine-protein kinase